MGEDLARIPKFHQLGARYMSIAHNRHSQLGDSHTPEEPLHNGLSELGKQAILQMNRVGIMVDVSHASKAAMLHAIACSKAPVIASHSGAAALRAHGRNLDDEQLAALQKNGGVIQVVALGSFLKDDANRRNAQQKLRDELGLPDPQGQRRRNRDGVPLDSDAEFEKKLALYQQRLPELDQKFPPANVATLVDHIDHVVKKIGIDHVGISTDFDGGGGIAGFHDASETFNVTLELVRRGYSEAQIGKIWSGNTLRLWRDVETVAKKLQKQKGDD
jgi:membrane dipeptidase